VVAVVVVVVVLSVPLILEMRGWMMMLRDHHALRWEWKYHRPQLLGKQIFLTVCFS
jgi:hypothetical protein